MTKTAALLLGAGSVAVVIGIVLLYMIFIDVERPDPEPKTQHVEIIAPKGTQVFARLPGEDENLLGEAPLTVNVRVDATIILRCEDKEKTYLPDSWKAGRINEPSFCPDPPPPRPPVVTVSINAVPWAEVFIKLPGTGRFVKPPEKKSNITPIRGGLRVPIGTEIKLAYRGSEKVFPYESWKESKSISHDFSNP